MGEDNVLRDVWHQDVTERLEYGRDQHKSGNPLEWESKNLNIFV